MGHTPHILCGRWGQRYVVPTIFFYKKNCSIPAYHKYLRFLKNFLRCYFLFDKKEVRSMEYSLSCPVQGSTPGRCQWNALISGIS